MPNTSLYVKSRSVIRHHSRCGLYTGRKSPMSPTPPVFDASVGCRNWNFTKVFDDVERVPRLPCSVDCLMVDSVV